MLYSPGYKQVTEPFNIRIPASTANLGPGFDCLGMALDIWNDIQFSPGGKPSVEVIGEGAGQLSGERDNLVYMAAERYFQETGVPVPAFSVISRNRIPLTRGLGSSSAAIVGGLFGASIIAGAAEPDMDLLWKLAVDIEGHPDNVTPALFGGTQVVVKDETGLVRAQIPVAPDLRAVLFIPNKPMPTDQARDIVPSHVRMEDAVYNMGRIALLVNALVTGRVEDLRVATQDRLHQPARQALLPSMVPLFRGALDGGALGVFLSGAGSTILALTQGNEITVAREMEDAANKAGVQGIIKITRPSPQGAQITDKEPGAFE
jgi:homoserine kinase